MIKRNVELAQRPRAAGRLAVDAGAGAAGPRRARHPRALADRDHGEDRAGWAAARDGSGRTGRRPGRAEFADAERLAREALADVRATVSGMRQLSLPVELAAARQALDAAGIAAELPSAVDDVPPGYRELFAFALREGVTNVVRHSRGSRCVVALTRDSLEVRDDGRGAGRSRQRCRAERDARAGGCRRCARRDRPGCGGRIPAAGGARVIRLLLADDQALVRGALAALLDLESDLEVVAEVSRGDEVVPAAVAGQADVALLDVEMPGMDGIAATAALRRALPSCRVLIVTTFGRPGYLRRAIEAGASGFVVKDTPARQLAEAVRRVHAGLRVLDPALAEESLVSGASPLTARETEVLRAARGGDTVADVAAVLHLSEGTVRNHLSSAIGKTGARNRAEAVKLAEDRGWLL